MNKRYAIVRVKYDVCPIKYMIPKSYKNRCILHNRNCEQCGRTGDTKEQLIKKVAQASINYYESRPFSKVNFQDMARWIVEFLGVEE